MIIWTSFECSKCSRSLRSVDIATIYYTRECPKCKSPIRMNSDESLKETLGARSFIYIWILILIIACGSLIDSYSESIVLIVLFVLVAVFYSFLLGD